MSVNARSNRTLPSANSKRADHQKPVSIARSAQAAPHLEVPATSKRLREAGPPRHALGNSAASEPARPNLATPGRILYPIEQRLFDTRTRRTCPGSRGNLAMTQI